MAEDLVPYAYEYGKSNGDGTYSVVIERPPLRSQVSDRPAIPLYTAPPADAGMPDEVGWLIEMSDPPVYCVFNPDDLDEQWTPDISRAIRFARREDAQACADHTGWTSPPVRVVEHIWTDGARQKVVASSNGHHWIKAFNLTCCRDCGVVRRADDKNSTCKGTVRVRPRTAGQAPGPSDPSSTRSDVTVSELKEFLASRTGPGTSFEADAIMLLDQFEIRRK
ncbi:MAG: hypothetical protein WBB98_04950 [Xanthobacteraceae bacterium]